MNALTQPEVYSFCRKQSSRLISEMAKFSGFGRLSYPGTMPWPEVPIGNHDHTNAAVVIIGGGISGMCMAIELLVNRHIKNFVILEKSGGFGGTWRDNKFPGCCCDVWSQLYCYSFEQNPDWSRAYPGQEEILNYLTEVAHKYELYKYARFNTVVDEAKWNDKLMKWETKVSVGGGKDSEFGSQYTITSDFLVSGTGQLNTPRGINVPGHDSYQGKIVHSARWDWSYHMENKRIAIIGTGATTAQIVPEVARVASHLTVCQRSPAWVIPRHDVAIPMWQRQLLKWLPPLRWRHRAEAMDKRESFYSAVTQADSPYAEWMRTANQTMMRAQLPDREDLWEVLTPDYSPGCKRTVISDDYYPALARSNVELETTKIERFTKKGIQFHGKEEQEFDLIILATGFESLSFLSPIKVVGRNNRTLDSIWSHAAHAYKGVTVPQLPNFAMLYGPNTNLSHNSLILMIEAQARYISVLVGEVLDARVRGDTLALEPNGEVCRVYNDTVQAALQRTSFADPACNSWWKREDGLIPNNWHGTAIDYQKTMASVDWADFEAEGSGCAVFRGKAARGVSVRIGRVVEETRVGRLGLALIAVGIMGVCLWFVRVLGTALF